MAQDDAWWNKLIQLLQFRDDIPYEKLKTTDLDELEDFWAKGEGCQPASGKATATKAPAKPKPKPKPAAKTPLKKVSSSLPKYCKVRVNSILRDTLANAPFKGLPEVILQRAQDQSDRAATPSSQVKSRKRDPSADPSGVTKRPRTELDKAGFRLYTVLAFQCYIYVFIAQSSKTTVVVKPSKPATSSRSASRSGSMAPIAD